MKYLILGILAALLVTQANAQTTYELEGRNYILPAFVCSGGTVGDVKLTYPPDFPSTGIWITQTRLSNNGPFGLNNGGQWEVLFDRGGRYIANSGWPATQNGSFYPLIRLNDVTIGQNPSPPPNNLSPWLLWRPGDVILFDLGCVGGSWIQPMFGMTFAVPEGQTIPGPFNMGWSGDGP